MPSEKPLIQRCPWPGDDSLYIDYHDKEWGTPLHDDNRLFEFLILEGAQAGLSWITILRKRENYIKAFDHFNAEKIARYTPRKIEQLLNNPGIIRNRLKINATVSNAQAYLEILEQYSSFDEFIWKFVDGKPLQNKWKTMKSVPASTKLSEQMSKELKQRGFKFVGSTICYAYMQATGMVNDHLEKCFRHQQLCKHG
jgi:DNA-3-methyladenine glycosylase I